MKIARVKTAEGKIISGTLIPEPVSLEEDLELTIAEARGCSYPVSDKAAAKALMEKFIITERSSETEDKKSPCPEDEEPF